MGRIIDRMSMKGRPEIRVQKQNYSWNSGVHLGMRPNFRSSESGKPYRTTQSQYCIITTRRLDGAFQQ